MLEPNTVIVLGAGASAPFDLPLGDQLYKSLIKQLGAWDEKLRQPDRPFSVRPFSVHNVEYFRRDPIGSLVAYLNSPLSQEFLPNNFDRQSVPRILVEFLEQLRSQTSDTIDRFIHDNPGHQLIGKILLAQNIILPMYDHPKDSAPISYMTLRTFAERDFGPRRNWYHKLINLMRLDASDGEAVSNNGLTIVTFNYDLSLERALESSLGSTERHATADWKKAVRILHVNGGPTSLEPRITDAGRFIVESARSISLVEEEPDDHLHSVRGQARHAIQKANKIFIIGFDFDSTNVATIGLTNPRNSKVYCLNYDGNSGLANRIRGLGISDANVKAGAPDNPLHIDRAIDEGFLRQ